METALRPKPQTRRKPLKKAALGATLRSLCNPPPMSGRRASRRFESDSLKARVRDYSALARKRHDLRRTQHRIGKLDAIPGLFAWHCEQPRRERLFQANRERRHIADHSRELRRGRITRYRHDMTAAVTAAQACSVEAEPKGSPVRDSNADDDAAAGSGPPLVPMAAAASIDSASRRDTLAALGSVRPPTNRPACSDPRLAAGSPPRSQVRLDLADQIAPSEGCRDRARPEDARL